MELEADAVTAAWLNLSKSRSLRNQEDSRQEQNQGMGSPSLGPAASQQEQRSQGGTGGQGDTTVPRRE